MKVALIILFILHMPLAVALRPPSRIQAQSRVVAIGDVHGDFSATQKALKIAKVMNDSEEWIGGNTFLVQTGDQLDRGDGERQLIDLLEKLRPKAQKAGGDILVLNGNHEAMNVDLDFRYVTQAGFANFANLYNHSRSDDSELDDFPQYMRGRVLAFRPGGKYAKIFGQHNTLMIIGQTLFLHGGLTPDYMYMELENINQKIADWMSGEAARPDFITDARGPLWSRDYSSDMSPAKCHELEQVLDHLALKRMVVAHTVFDHINSACQNKVWRIDVGMSNAYGGEVEVLEILHDKILNILR